MDGWLAIAAGVLGGPGLAEEDGWVDPGNGATGAATLWLGGGALKLALCSAQNSM